ncbi:MAG: hypothetical protein AAF658_06430 [Myxococcota bacterium]
MSKNTTRVGRLAEALAHSHPDLISDLVALEREARERAEVAFFSRLSKHEAKLQSLEEKLAERVDAQIRGSTLVKHLTDEVKSFREDVTRTSKDVLDDVRATQTKLQEQVSAAERDLSERYGRLMREAASDRDSLLHEMRSRYDDMFSQWRKEREDALREKETASASLLAESRTSFELREEQARADFDRVVSDLTAQIELTERIASEREHRTAESSRAQAEAFETLRREMTEMIREARSEASRAREGLSALEREKRGIEEDLDAALRSRDSLVERVEQVEENLQHVVVEYRNELEDRRARIEELELELRGARSEVDWYRNEIGAAGLLPARMRN